MYRKLLFISFFIFINLITLNIHAYPQPINEQGITEIQVEVIVLDLEEVNSADQNFTANVYFLYQWHDKTLAHAGKENTRKSINDIWHPSFQILNQQRIWETLDNVVEISPEGDVFYQQRVWGSFSQPLDLANFPFDVHTLHITIVPVAYTVNDSIKFLQHSAHPSVVAKELSIPDWSVLSYDSKSSYYQPLPEMAKTPAFTFTFEIERHSGYYMVKIILPLMLIVFMSWIVFWIDPKDTGTQIAVAVTSMLTLIAYRFSLGEILPKISYLTNLDILILGSTILVFASLIEVVYTSFLAKNKKLSKARTIDKSCRWTFSFLYLVLILVTIYS
ncbi:MAG TPA: hypothetical protein QF753_15845 [Victivallales bacterium]|nr:hypothetical protein [Victivallales bacterium]